MQNIDIVKNCEKNVRRFNLRGRTIEFKIKPVPSDENAISWVKDAIKQAVCSVTEDVQPNDKIGFSLCAKNFEKGEVWINFQDAEKVTFNDIWGVLEKIYQSNSSGLDTDTFCLKATIVRLPKGKGRSRHNNYNSFIEECGMRRGIVTINNKDRLCLPRALVVAVALVDADPEYIKVRRDIGKTQTTRAKTLMREAGVIEISEAGAGIPELQKFQQHLTNYKVVVYRYKGKGRDVIFSGPGEGKKLNLLFHDGHYNVITSLTAAFCCSYFCEECHIPYYHKNEHRCGGTCSGCQQSPPCVLEGSHVL